MKKFSSLLMCVVFLLAILAPTVEASQGYGQKGKLTSGVFTYTLIDKGKAVRIDVSKNAKGKVTIPAKIKGKPVTEIGKGAFYTNNITSVVIPKGVKKIGANAFGFCVNLNSVTLPSTLTSIGNMAFAFCESLKSIKIPAKVKKIGADVFSGCSSLSKVTLHSGITSINEFAFMGARLNTLTISVSLKKGKSYTLPKLWGKKWTGGNTKVLTRTKGTTYKAKAAGKATFKSKSRTGQTLKVVVTVVNK